MCLTEFMDLWILLEKCSDLLIQDSCEDFWHRPSNYLNRDVHLGWRLVRHWEGRPGRIRRIREETWHYWHRLYAFFWDFTELKTLKTLPLSFFSQMDGDSLSFLYVLMFNEKINLIKNFSKFNADWPGYFVRNPTSCRKFESFFSEFWIRFFQLLVILKKKTAFTLESPMSAKSSLR